MYVDAIYVVVFDVWAFEQIVWIFHVMNFFDIKDIISLHYICIRMRFSILLLLKKSSVSPEHNRCLEHGTTTSYNY